MTNNIIPHSNSKSDQVTSIIYGNSFSNSIPSSTGGGGTSSINSQPDPSLQACQCTLCSQATSSYLDNRLYERYSISPPPSIALPMLPPQNSYTTGIQTKRQKALKACVYCKRSHMTCDNGILFYFFNLDRPCKRCIFRKIGHLCRDEELPTTKLSALHTKFKKRPDTPSSLQTFQNLQSFDQHVLPMTFNNYFTTSTLMTNYKCPTLLDSNHQFRNTFEANYNFLPSNRFSEKLNSNIVSSTSQATIFPNPLYQLSEVFPTVLLSNQEFSFDIDNQKYNYLRSVAAPCQSASGSYTFEDRLNHIIAERYKCGLIKPFDFNKAFDFFIERSKLSLSESSISKICSLIDEDISLTTSKSKGENITEADLVNVEVSLYRMLLEYDRYLRTISIPTLIWRRSGDILRINYAFSKVIGTDLNFLLPKISDIISTTEYGLHIVDFLCENSLLNYWRRYLSIAYDISQRTVLTSAFLKCRRQESFDLVLCSLSLTIRRDVHGMPFLIIGQFIPIEYEYG